VYSNWPRQFLKELGFSSRKGESLTVPPEACWE
jgi:hypothetical protein